jgi:Rrf2 family transcriptional regulator, iron-sulfur cluster assembly transcription factor
MFSKACEYGIRATIFIAEQSIAGEKVGQIAIAKAIDSPMAFTAKTLQILTRNNIVSAERGPNGGFYLDANQLNTVMLSNIVSAIDGNEIYRGCALGLKHCNEKMPCPVHFQFKSIRDELQQMLETTTLQDLAIGLKSGLTFLKR